MSTTETPSIPTAEQPLTFTIAEGIVTIPVKDIQPAVQVLINTVQERRSTIGNLQRIITSLTESNGVDTNNIIGNIRAYATQNPSSFTPHPTTTPEETATEESATETV